jgi:hypothetical protein
MSTDFNSDLLHGVTGCHPVLKTTEVAHIGVAEVLEGLTGEDGTNTGAAIDQHRLIPLERGQAGMYFSTEPVRC